MGRPRLVDPATGTPVTGTLEVPFPDTGNQVLVTFFGVPLGRWNVIAVGIDSRGRPILQSDPASVDILPAVPTSAVVTLTGAPDLIRFFTPPADSVVGQTLPAVVVEVIDVDGVRATADIPVTVALGNNPGNANLSGTTTVLSSQGLATFVDLSLDEPGAGCTLVASGPQVAPVESPPFDIVPQALPPSQLAFLGQPSDVQEGATITPAVTVAIQDQNGVVVTTASAPVTLALDTNPGGGTLGGTTTVNAVNGVATFPDLTVDEAGPGYTLQATSGTLAPDTSDPFNVTPPPPQPTQLAFVSQPTDVLVGDSIFPAVTVEIQDQNGILIPTATLPVTAALDSNPGGGTLGGTTTVNAVNGVATFVNLSVSAAGAGTTLQATSGTLAPDTSNAFNVIAPGPRMFAYLTEGYQGALGSGLVRGLILDEPTGFFVGTTPGDPYPAANSPAFLTLDRFFNFLFTTHPVGGPSDDLFVNALIDPVDTLGQVSPLSFINLGPGVTPGDLVHHPFLARVYSTQQSTARVGMFDYDLGTGTLGAPSTVPVGGDHGSEGAARRRSLVGSGHRLGADPPLNRRPLPARPTRAAALPACGGPVCCSNGGSLCWLALPCGEHPGRGRGVAAPGRLQVSNRRYPAACSGSRPGS